MTTLETEINKILSKWNPIGVPQEIAEIEYISYIPEIIKAYKERKSIYSYSILVYTEDMGYDLQKEAEVGAKKASDQIFQVLVNLS